MLKHLILIIGIISVSLFADVEILKPQIAYKLDLSPAGKQIFNKGQQLYYKESSSNITTENRKAIEVYTSFTEAESGWAMGCSWYCGGGPCTINATSALSSSDANTYAPKNAHDFNLETAWIEGKNDYGIGESLIYVFSPNAAIVTKLYILNGYMKSLAAWKNNSRVKIINVYFNDILYKKLQLEDSTGVQVFNIGSPLGSSREHNGYTLRFEIADVYPGDKYKDTAITEISLDGVGVHCVAGDTLINTAQNKTVKIEAIIPGDHILAYDTDRKTFSPKEVLQNYSVYHKNIYEVTTKTKKIRITDDHKFLTKDNKMICIKDLNKAADLIGVNIILYENGNSFVEKIIKIRNVASNKKTYTLRIKDSQNNCFIANGLLVSAE